MQRAVDAVILSLITFVSAGFALSYLIQPESMTPFWIANAILLAALLRRPPQDWPVLLFSSYVGYVAAAGFFRFSIQLNLFFGAINVLESFIAAFLIHRFAPRLTINKLRNLILLIFSSLVACLTSATLAWVVGPIHWPLWFLDDWLGILLVTPTLLVFWPGWKRFPQFTLPRFTQFLEMTTILLGMVAVSSVLIFYFDGSPTIPNSYASLPFLLWATLRYRTKGATIACLCLGLITFGFALYGFGPFAFLGDHVIDRSLMVQAFLAIVLLSHLSLGVALVESGRSSEVEKQQIKILECISRDQSLESILEEIVYFVEAQEAGLLCSILLADLKDGRLWEGAAPSLPEKYNAAVNGLPIGPGIGSCGAAAYTRQIVIISDIETHPNWASGRHLAREHGLKACWSSPIFSHTSEVLGTFAIYYRENREPSSDELAWVAVATHLAAVAIQKQRNDDQRTTLEKKILFARQMESLGTLASGIAHDFNNILTAIIGNASLARKKVQPEDSVQKNLDTIKTAGQRGSDLVQRILTFSKQKAAIHSQTNLRPIIEEALALLRATLPAMIEVHTSFEDQVSEVLADASQIHQIVMNLGVNAAQAMEGRGGVLGVHLETVTLHSKLVSIHSEVGPGRYVRLKVSDTGPGISDEIIAKIFDPFFTTKAPGRGTGLGLSAVHGIVKSHDGAITVESIPGRGTVFSLFFPIAEAELVVADTKVVGEELQGNKQQILYVDDDEAVAQVMSELLKSKGYIPIIRSKPVDALQEVLSNPENFSAILIDHEMPLMTGLEFLRQLRARNIKIPVILVSGFLNERMIDESRELNVHDVLLKPDFLDKVPVVLGGLFS